MTDHDSTATPDALHRFLLERAGVRGVLVRLDATWQTIRSTSDYAGPVARLLGEATAAAALFTGHAKVEGRLSVQMKGTGPLRTLFAECTAQGTLRGLAHAEDAVPACLSPRDLGEGAVLAITIENQPAGAPEPQRYQGLVDLDADTLGDAFEGYFANSEQLPTLLRLTAEGDTAAGLMLQRLPGDHGDSDGWTRVGALLETLRDDELRALPAEQLLWRLFHEEDARLLAYTPLSFGCSCSRERVEAVLRGIGEEEALAAAASGEAEIRCEFCGTAYRFDRGDIEALFGPAATHPAPPGLQ
ncbi:Hsp33 family molecular chaperone HslO [Coralloluteibacterium stylophorae]|uniref:Hsp33 family molecular chaperone HslO n=2 Tax=Coralloluteibacterium stylophorae TaxID=1776034 RepID=A0AAP2C8R9_9GAMM|nr:Hsp33 family molecular chaperone HslO [Coralloluteibacterium stylophorae]MBS7456072.1 Hsp33 family molecular chaperone HslO [Coralloluteibacterium stylophorae]